MHNQTIWREDVIMASNFESFKTALNNAGLLLDTEATNTHELLEELPVDTIGVDGSACDVMLCLYGWWIWHLHGAHFSQRKWSGPPLYCFFTKYDDEDEAVFAGGATFAELDKVIRKLPDYCHYIDVKVQLKLGSLLTHAPLLRSLPVVEYYPTAQKERRMIEDMLSQLREGFLNGDQRIELFRHGQVWYYKLSNRDYHTIAGKQHLAMKRILYSEGKLLASNGRLDYKSDSSSNAMTYILVPSEGRTEVLEQHGH